MFVPNHFFCRCIHLKAAVVFIENNCPVLLVCLLLGYLRLFNESIWQAQSRIFRSLVWGVDRHNICPYLQADANNLWVFCAENIFSFNWPILKLSDDIIFLIFRAVQAAAESYWPASWLRTISGSGNFQNFARTGCGRVFVKFLSPQGSVIWHDFPRFCRITWNWVGLLLDVRSSADNSYRAPGKFPT